ncbi:MAG: phosphate signaling complex protein PhoU [Pseudomonadota bacterium]
MVTKGTPAMRIRLGRKIENLKKQLLALGAQVEEHVRLAVKAVDAGEPLLAARVIDGDREIDQAEVDLEERCLEILALHQPVANDLRFIVAVMKINNDLERIGDLAVNIAETAVFVSSQKGASFPFDYGTMAEKTRRMLKKSLDAFVNLDEQSAYEVCAQDDEVDYLKHVVHRKFEELIRSPVDRTEAVVHLFLVSRHLERIADHATNIAEDVIYMVTGQIHRHRGALDVPDAAAPLEQQ